MTNLDRLQAGREQMRIRCEAIAAKYLQAVTALDHRATEHRPRKSLSGRAYIALATINGGIWIIEAPRPVTRRGLYIFLHECAHHLLGHCDGTSKPKHVRELEAETWAHQTMRAEGLAVPRKETERARKYVAWKIKQALKRGAKHIDKRAAEFAGMKIPENFS